MKSTLYIYSIILTFTSLLIACSGGGAGSSNTPSAPATGNISGQVLNAESGSAIVDATVSTGSQTTTTGADGRYRLENVNFDDRVVVDIKRAGFAEQSKITQLSALKTQASLPVLLLPVDLTQTFDPNIGQTLVVADSSASVTLLASSLITADGNSPEGNVSIELTVIDPTQDIALMPGNMQANTGAGELSPIESFGAIVINFTDSMGNELDLIQGATASIQIPLADKSGSPPEIIPLYFYDESTGLWVEEGSATLVVDAGQSYYQGTVRHFSTWNADSLYPQVIINGCVEDLNGERIANAGVISSGDDYSGTSSTLTDSSGAYSIIVKQNASVLISGLRAGAKTNTIKISTTTTEQAIDECLMFSVDGQAGNTSVSIKLSWGENPQDLDSYLIGPVESGFSISFGTPGSLQEFPFSQLDVDDTNSFGPEIITIFNFSFAGNYRYSVNNFNETFSPGITESPSRVELNVNGNITIFMPPENEGDNITWDVFDFVVADDGSFTVAPVNTWSAFRP
ncbi:hypothetical protein MNBD_GAMMA10-143 [hydrothermal vent metagenome]|uniref:Carboxypeptidase regulatory-like domain-containing protein n=1 Tax=hydrothermal vent metagenome TaxID=652676 RepID=A0A3B0XTW5_9ZZZZ